MQGPCPQIAGALRLLGAPQIAGGLSDCWGPLRLLGALVHCTTCTTHCYATAQDRSYKKNIRPVVPI